MRKASFYTTLLSSAAMACIGLVPQAHAWTYNGSPDLFNGWNIPQLDPTGQCGPDAMEFDFPGNVSAQLGTPVTDDYWINAEYANQLAGGPPANPVTVTYDPVANVTSLVESGGDLPLNPGAGWLGPVQISNGVPTLHTGANLGWHVTSSPLYPISREWQWDCNGVHTVGPLPWLSVAAHKPVTAKTNPKKVAYAGIFIQTKDGANGNWILAAYQQAATVTFDVTNASPMSVSIGLAGIVMNLPVSLTEECQANPQCSDNEAMLDKLSGGAWPLPGQSGSPYKVIKLTAKPLKPGETIHFKAP
jgi:hypothetical protein